jgi:hypothetical protein
MALTPILLAVPAVAMVAAGWSMARQLRLLLQDPDSLAASHHLVRAIRALVVVACAGVFMAAVARSSKTLLVLGTIILAEEIYETGVALLILRAERQPSGDRP